MLVKNDKHDGSKLRHCCVALALLGPWCYAYWLLVGAGEIHRMDQTYNDDSHLSMHYTSVLVYNNKFATEAIGVTLGYPQDGGSVCCCYDYCVDVRIVWYVCCVLQAIGCVMSDACHTEQEYRQDGGCGKKKLMASIMHKEES